MINDKADEVMKELSGSLKPRYQNNLESMQGSEFVFDYVNLLYYKCHKINPNFGRSYIESPDWIKSRKAIINPNNKKPKCFQYTLTVPLSHQEIKEDPQRIAKIKPFINKHNWEGTNFLQKKMIGKKLRKIM